MRTSTQKTQLATTSDVAARLGFSKRRVQQLADSGQLTYSQKLPGRNGAYLFSSEDLALYELKRSQADAKQGV